MSNLIKEPTPEDFEAVIRNGPFPIRFPKVRDLDQDEEWCAVQIEGQWKKIRFHDYHEVFKIPGLYETIFYRTLRCNSPSRIAELLSQTMTELGISANDLRVLDFGAGNGMGGEALQTIGVRNIVGVDILEEAKAAAERDRPWVYDYFQVSDFTALKNEEVEFYQGYDFNMLLTVAALGFGDIPPEAFYNAYNFISEGGLIAFNIKDEFLRMGKRAGFSKLIYSMLQEEYMQIELYKRYQHRLNIQGEPLYYVIIVARKHRNIPKSLLAE
jgi:SAM-dependent methyltransferase